MFGIGIVKHAHNHQQDGIDEHVDGHTVTQTDSSSYVGSAAERVQNIARRPQTQEQETERQELKTKTTAVTHSGLYPGFRF